MELWKYSWKCKIHYSGEHVRRVKLHIPIRNCLLFSVWKQIVSNDKHTAYKTMKWKAKTYPSLRGEELPHSANKGNLPCKLSTLDSLQVHILFSAISMDGPIYPSPHCVINIQGRLLIKSAHISCGLLLLCRFRLLTWFNRGSHTKFRLHYGESNSKGGRVYKSK